jgi:TolB protein
MNPTFSPDGFSLAYTVNSAGFDQIFIQDFQELNSEPSYASQGREIAWSPDGQRLAAVIHDPNGTNVVSYSIGDTSQVPLGLLLGSGISGLDWSGSGLPGEIFLNKYEATPSPLYEIVSNPDATGRFVLVDLPSVSAPNPTMSDAVDEAFNALRERTAEELGWDFLASLENAFVGVNDPLPPGYAYNDWLYTGRAFAFNHAAVTAGWVEVVREDYGGRTYWHVFVRTSVQDGSLGEPLRTLPWDFSVRRNGDSLTYDQGGSIRSQLPRGFYVNFTQLAADFGFERLPALANWRSFYPSTRFDEFAYTGGLDWTSAMLELYPASAIVTPTPYRTPTPTPTRTLRPSLTPWWSWRTSTPNPTSPPPPPPTSTP